jgi:hypothetical protein
MEGTVIGTVFEHAVDQLTTDLLQVFHFDFSPLYIPMINLFKKVSIKMILLYERLR